MRAEERFWPKVDVGDCWQWAASTQKGYGHFWDGFRLVLAHRFAYELLVGPIPRGLTIDHLCRNRGCVNPDHMEVVTHAENMRRSYPMRKTHCPRGHAYDGANTYVHRGKRKCRACHREQVRRASHGATSRSTPSDASMESSTTRRSVVVKAST